MPKASDSPIAPLQPKSQPWDTDYVARTFFRFESFGFLLCGLGSKRSVFAKPITVDELMNVVKRFSEEHCENVLHSVALNVLKRANLCVQQNGGPFQHLL